MRVAIVAIGRAGRGPEAALIEDYLRRFDAAGRPMALGPATVLEMEDKKRKGREEEARLLASAAPDGAFRIALDERGKVMDSRAFAALLADIRDQGTRDLAFFIGGADGLAPMLRDGAERRLSFGDMVWPHMLARVMLAEQLYRAASILAGAPYHRD